jgi:mono/diheme cytochrome c family protein
MLIGITKVGLVPPYAPAGYESDMPAFGSRLTDEQIRDVLSYIASRWPARVTELRARLKSGK